MALKRHFLLFWQDVLDIYFNWMYTIVSLKIARFGRDGAYTYFFQITQAARRKARLATGGRDSLPAAFYVLSLSKDYRLGILLRAASHWGLRSRAGVLRENEKQHCAAKPREGM